jgi:hypothetical protein
MMLRRDWFTFADPDAVRTEYNAGPRDLEEMLPGVWGIPGVGVVCLGDMAHMRKVQEKRFTDRFHASACPRGHYGVNNGGPPLPSVAERLAK